MPRRMVVRIPQVAEAYGSGDVASGPHHRSTLVSRTRSIWCCPSSEGATSGKSVRMWPPRLSSRDNAECAIWIATSRMLRAMSDSRSVGAVGVWAVLCVFYAEFEVLF